jgi:hypothetical protein
MFLQQRGIQHKKIQPYTPRHNGKVERSHRKDNERFYATHRFFSFEDFSCQLKRYNYEDYNCFPMRPLKWKSPQTVLRDFIRYGVTYVWQTHIVGSTQCSVPHNVCGFPLTPENMSYRIINKIQAGGILIASPLFILFPIKNIYKYY